MDTIYDKIRGYKGVKILKIRSGSIIVDHEVILSVKTSDAVSHNFLNKTVEEIKTTLKNTTSSEGNNTGFHFDTSSVVVKEPVLTADCASKVPVKLKQYYKLVVIGEKTICASVCNSARKDSMKCGNGMCGMKSHGPNCYCDVSQDYWHYGEYCNRTIHKKGFIAGLSVTLIVLLLGLLALVIYNVKFRKSIKHTQTKREDEQMKEIMEKWEEDDWEWHSPGTIIINNRDSNIFGGNANSYDYECTKL
ncbi:mucin-3A-like [Rhinoraja longicauda]